MITDKTGSKWDCVSPTRRIRKLYEPGDWTPYLPPYISNFNKSATVW